MALNFLEDAVANATSFFDIARLKGEAQALSSSVGFVHRYVAPPHTTVVPKVVVEVIIVDTKRDFSLLRCHFSNVKGKCER